jgi:cytochrome c oxidase assembly protein subunit 15
LFIQIFLGGWTSTNYAALSCGEEFPTCLGTWWPAIDFSQAFYWGPIGVDYEYGTLDNITRAGIQYVHRIGALITTVVVLFMLYRFRQHRRLRAYLMIIGILLIVQIALGIANVLLSLPLTIAVLHNVTALLLLLSMVALLNRSLKI